MRIGLDARLAIQWFAQSLVAGEFGPDDSRDGRSAIFLKYPAVVAQAISIFLYNLEMDDETGRVLNHDEAEQRARQFVQWECFRDEIPDPPFSDDELGILSLDEPPQPTT
jgi:hypothetical protein